MPPVIETRTTPDGAAGFVANALLGPMEGARFSTGLGFEVQLQMSLQITATSARANLDRIVHQHAKPEIKHLLLTAGGPDRGGMRFPGEEAIAALITEQPGLSVAAGYLERVTLHLWSARRIIEIAVESRPRPDSTRADYGTDR